MGSVWYANFGQHGEESLVLKRLRFPPNYAIFEIMKTEVGA